MARKPDPKNLLPKFNIGTLKMGVDETIKFRNALDYYGWESIAMFLRQTALALIRQWEAGEPIVQPLSFQMFSADTAQPRTTQRRKYGHLLETVANEQVARENKPDA